MAAMPTAGPSESQGKAQRQVSSSAIKGTPRIVTRVSKNPSAVWSARAVPRVSSSLVSVTIAENWALSATTANPHTRKSGTTISGERPKTSGVARPAAPEINSDPPANSVRPNRSAQWPNSQAPSPPAAMMKNVAVGT